VSEKTKFTYARAALIGSRAPQTHAPRAGHSQLKNYSAPWTPTLRALAHSAAAAAGHCAECMKGVRAQRGTVSPLLLEFT